MTHEEVVELFPALAAPPGADEQLSRARGHLESCESCRELLDTFVLLRQGFVAAEAAHPEAAEIVAYAAGEEPLTTADASRIAAHVGSCTVCAAEVEAVRLAETERRPGPQADAVEREPPVPHRGVPRWYLAAAAAAFVLAGTSSYLAAVRLPQATRSLAELRRQNDTLRAEQRALHAPIVLHVLEPVLRGAGDEVEPEFAAHTSTLVGLPLVAPEGTRDDEAFVLELLAPTDGRPVATWPLGGAWVRASALASGLVTVLVPRALEPGRYRLRLRRADDAGAPVIAESAFVIARP